MSYPLGGMTDAAIDRDLAAMDADEREADAIADMAEQIAWSDDGIADAIGGASNEQWQRLCAALRSGDALRAGQELIALVQKYGEPHAYKQARAEFDLSQTRGNHYE